MPGSSGASWFHGRKVGFDDHGQVVGPFVSEDRGEQRGVTAPLGEPGIVGQLWRRGNAIDLVGKHTRELGKTGIECERQVRPFILRLPVEAACVAPGIAIADPVVPAVDDAVREFEPIGDVPGGQHAELGVGMSAEAEHVGGRQERAARCGGRLVSWQRKETAAPDVDATADRQVQLAVELNRVISECVGGKGFVQKPDIVKVLRVGSKQVIDAEAPVDLVAVFDLLLEHQIQLLEDESIGQRIREEHEVLPINTDLWVCGVVCLDPAEDPKPRLLEPEQAN
jgi:hypothetical protein